MAKNATASTRSVFDFIPGRPITWTDVRDVHRAQNHARTLASAQTLVNCSSGQGWLLGIENGPGGEAWDPSTGIGVTQEVYFGQLYIDPDSLLILAHLVMDKPTSTTAIVRVYVDIGTDSWNFTAPTASGGVTGGVDYANSTIAFDTSSTGTGWKDWRLRVQRLKAGDWQLFSFSIHAGPRAVSNLSDPTL